MWGRERGGHSIPGTVVWKGPGPGPGPLLGSPGSELTIPEAPCGAVMPMGNLVSSSQTWVNSPVCRKGSPQKSLQPLEGQSHTMLLAYTTGFDWASFRPSQALLSCPSEPTKFRFWACKVEGWSTNHGKAWESDNQRPPHYQRHPQTGIRVNHAWPYVSHQPSGFFCGGLYSQYLGP